MSITNDDATSTKCILDALEGHCKPISNEIVAAASYKQLVQGSLGLPEYIERCKDITAACNFEVAYGKYLWNAILLYLGDQGVYGKCTEVGDN